MEWTEERVTKLKSLWGEGRTASQIAVLLGDVTRNAVIGKAHRLGLKGRPSPIRKDKTVTPKPARRPAVQASRPAGKVSDRQCHWPIGHPREPGFHFCGAQAIDDKPYCAKHCNVAYRRTESSAAA
ncbi:MAG: GcrA family cell cycle regulator [Alphaproteobacteria bacterium]|jgi:GcrA cell cycle regulator|nr:GcrA family cell cycle regulator [Alphaproteobacteria bacterium]